jgi:hypothetical protein
MLGRALIRLTLAARCVACLWLAMHLATTAPSDYPVLAQAFAIYAVTDGALALLLALLTLMAHLPGAISVVAMVGGVIRVGAALTIWWGPGIPHFGLTTVLYLGVLATLGLLFGIIQILEARRLQRRIGQNPLSVILIGIGIGTIALAVVALIVNPLPIVLGRLLIFGTLVEALALLAVALRVGDLQRRVTVGERTAP